MNNPWQLLPENQPYILEEDRIVIEQFNLRAKPEHHIHLDLLPEPFLGNPNAQIVLLGLNPGYSAADVDDYKHPEFISSNRQNLIHAEEIYPFYLLNPKFCFAGGYKWWTKKLRPLISKVEQEKLASNILCVEFFPYHSLKYHYAARCPSQAYSFYLVQKAIERQALIIAMRSSVLWKRVVTDLSNYSNFYRLNSPQNVIVSQNNCPEGYSKIVELLQ